MSSTSTRKQASSVTRRREQSGTHRSKKTKEHKEKEEKEGKEQREHQKAEAIAITNEEQEDDDDVSAQVDDELFSDPEEQEEDDEENETQVAKKARKEGGDDADEEDQPATKLDSILQLMQRQEERMKKQEEELLSVRKQLKEKEQAERVHDAGRAFLQKKSRLPKWSPSTDVPHSVSWSIFQQDVKCFVELAPDPDNIQILDQAFEAKTLAYAIYTRIRSTGERSLNKAMDEIEKGLRENHQDEDITARLAELTCTSHAGLEEYFRMFTTLAQGAKPPFLAVQLVGLYLANHVHKRALMARPDPFLDYHDAHRHAVQLLDPGTRVEVNPGVQQVNALQHSALQGPLRTRGNAHEHRPQPYVRRDRPVRPACSYCGKPGHERDACAAKRHNIDPTAIQGYLADLGKRREESASRRSRPRSH